MEKHARSPVAPRLLFWAVARQVTIVAASVARPRAAAAGATGAALLPGRRAVARYVARAATVVTAPTVVVRELTWFPLLGAIARQVAALVAVVAHPVATTRVTPGALSGR